MTARPGISRRALLAWLWEVTRFGAVGAVAFVVDMGLYNLLVHVPGSFLSEKPLTARIVSVAAATVVSWMGNRYVTFTGAKTKTKTNEFVQFAIVNVIGMGIGVGVLAFNRYVLGFDSFLADNIANVLGTALGMIFRYLAYKFYVFRDSDHDGVDVVADVASVPDGPAEE